MEENVLKHYGVKGMQWRHKKGPEEDSVQSQGAAFMSAVFDRIKEKLEEQKNSASSQNDDIDAARERYRKEFLDNQEDFESKKNKKSGGKGKSGGKDKTNELKKKLAEKEKQLNERERKINQLESLYDQRHRYESSETKRIVNEKFKRLMKHNNISDELYHHGIPGMRWGIRKNSISSAKINTPHGWAIKKIKSKLRERKLRKDSSYRKIRNMDSSQLKTLGDRIAREKELRQLGKLSNRGSLAFKLNAKRHYLNRTNMSDKQISDIIDRLKLEKQTTINGVWNKEQDKSFAKKIKKAASDAIRKKKK